MDSFFFSAYSFQIRARERLNLPPYKGSTLRGGMGQMLQRMVCRRRGQSCEECLVSVRCPYALIFKNPLPAGRTPFA
ncbi:MAG: hypothetical protein GXP58_12165, partial [Deltaproteobacteria bacterium]|nr:hypothetical protein [Deltaproteobacteria bacterium]